MLKVSRLISQKTTLAPRCSITFAVEIQVNAGIIISSPAPIPRAAKESSRPAVHEETAIECSIFVNLYQKTLLN